MVAPQSVLSDGNLNATCRPPEHRHRPWSRRPRCDPRCAVTDFERLFDEAPCGFLLIDLDGLIQRVNNRFATWTGYTVNELVGRRTFQELLSVDSQIYYQTHFAPTLGLQRALRDVALELNGINGQPILAVTNAELHEATATVPALVWLVLIDATARRSFEQESQRARQRLARLQRLTSAFAVALTRQEVVSVTVAEILDGTEGDHGFLADVVGDNLRILEALPNDEVAHAAWEASDIPNIPLLAQSMRSNTAVFMENSDGVGTLLPPLRTDGVSSRRVALLPMATAGQARGVLCVASSKEATFQPDERAFLVLFAELTAQAIERARLHDDAIVRAQQMVVMYDHERQVAALFQQHLLNRTMPVDGRIVLNASYQAGGELVEIGGDFFDAFFVTENLLAVAVGDVVGRGIPAATVMGQVRTALRAYALEGRGPAATLERLDAFAESIDGAFCTSVAYSELDLETGELRYACAGHPPPVLVLPVGGIKVLWDGRSPLLGVDPHVSKAEASVHMPAGARLLLYSDGLVETHTRAIDEGIAQLVTQLDANHDVELDQLSELVDGHGAYSDDVCVLSLTRRTQ